MDGHRLTYPDITSLIFSTCTKSSYSTLLYSALLYYSILQISSRWLARWLVLAWRHLGITKLRTVPYSHSIHPLFLSLAPRGPEFGRPADNNAKLSSVQSIDFWATCDIIYYCFFTKEAVQKQ